MYQRQVGNLKFQLKVNGMYFTDAEIKVIQQQIADREEFLNYLKVL